MEHLWVSTGYPPFFANGSTESFLGPGKSAHQNPTCNNCNIAKRVVDQEMEGFRGGLRCREKVSEKTAFCNSNHQGKGFSKQDEG